MFLLELLITTTVNKTANILYTVNLASRDFSISRKIASSKQREREREREAVTEEFTEYFIYYKRVKIIHREGKLTPPCVFACVSCELVNHFIWHANQRAVV